MQCITVVTYTKKEHLRSKKFETTGKQVSAKDIKLTCDIREKRLKDIEEETKDLNKRISYKENEWSELQMLKALRYVMILLLKSLN